MSLYDYYAAPEPEFSDEQWEHAYFQVCSELIREGHTRDDAERMADDWTVAEQAAFNRDESRFSAEAEAADRAIKRRKEES